MKVDTGFLRQLNLNGGFDANLCMNCGTCTALCPLGIDLMPRKLFRRVLLGDKESIVRHPPPIFSCLLCRMCESNCPAGVHIAENVRALRTYLNREIHGLAEA